MAPKLTKAQKDARLKFVSQRITDNDFWSYVLFYDVRKINLDGPDGFRYYWHDLRRDEQVFSKRAAHGNSELVFVSGRQDSTAYIQRLSQHLISNVEILREKYPEKPVGFQQDGCSYHTSRATKAWFADMEVDVMDWSSNSPDLNPIENVWGKLVRHVYEGGRQFDSVNKLRTQIKLSWKEITQDYVDQLIESTPRRLVAVVVVAARGGSVDY
ncbi:TPA: hypothetical protein N0F65_008032 [Lagenidium giganteum]|uniref:Tc1-like transposase DDE domain-containing protein n=1 Tax=Lagenidium giganteum TaxID=4803 RepID=A0AAV2YNI4_9STRA|nr:TPA: hypothetical protein N0F65_008032 [Lagenidium giganteum]